MPPPRGDLVKGDHVLISGVWFEMMNSAPQRRPSAAERSISDFSGNDGGLPRDGRGSMSSEEQSRSRDRGGHSHILVQRDEVQVLKPRPIQTRSITAKSTSSSNRKSQDSQNTIGGGRTMSIENGTRDRNGDKVALGDNGRIQIPNAGCPRSGSRWASTSDFCDSEGGIDVDSKASERSQIERQNISRGEHRDGHALVNDVHHQMLKPGVSAPRPRNKLRKTQKGTKNGRDGSVGVGSKGPRLIIP